MPRYIDADELEKTIKKSMTEVAEKSCDINSAILSGYLLAIDHAIDYMRIAPTVALYENAVIDFAKFLIDKSRGGKIYISDIPGFVVKYTEDKNK